MVDSETLHWVVTGLLGVIVALFKYTAAQFQKEVDTLKTEVKVLQETRLHKDDFREFKLELRAQFDEIKQAIRDLKPNG